MKELKSNTKLQKKGGDRGITLIALVITIVVLLILAGVSIMTLTGDNGLLTRTVGAKNKTKLAEAQEIANLEYEAGLIDSKVNTASEAGTIENIKNVLIEKGFTVDYETTSTESITGVRLLDGTTAVTSVNLTTTGENTEKILTIDAITGGVAGGRNYYVQIDNMWHKIEEHANKKGIEIKKDGKASLDKSNANNGNQTINIAISGLDDSTTVKKIVENGDNTTYEDITANTAFIKGDKIKITAGTSDLTNVTITVSVTNVIDTYNVALNVTKPLVPTATTSTSSLTIDNERGEIEVIWLDGRTNSKATAANIPNIQTGMKPVTWNLSDTSYNSVSWSWDSGESKWKPDSTSQTEWYNYKTTSYNNAEANQWANVTDPAGSYFVWIPRFAYRITYYNTSNQVVGYYDGYGLWTADGTVVNSDNVESGEIVATGDIEGKNYIVHNAFLTNTANGGGFGTKSGNEDGITGLWVAKFEMSREVNDGSGWKTDTTSTGNNSTSSTLRAVSKPGVLSWRSINIANCYTNSKNYGTQTFGSSSSVNSHLMKNSEWGAVAYLAHSQYGLNGTNIAINNSSTYTTGKSAGTSDASADTPTPSDYNEKTNGVKASSTGNIYGIYDLSGGAYEYVAAFNQNYSGNYFTGSYYKDANSSHFASNGGTSDAYATAYSNSTTNINGTFIYSVGITGDATKEVYKEGSGFSWNSDYANFVSSDWPFFQRGGFYGRTSGAGLFYSSFCFGSAANDTSFRVVLAP